MIILNLDMENKWLYIKRNFHKTLIFCRHFEGIIINEEEKEEGKKEKE